MKRCPTCNRVESDEALKFCRVDGTTLESESPGSSDEAELDRGFEEVTLIAGTKLGRYEIRSKSRWVD